MHWFQYIELVFSWLFVISNILASFIVSGILYYVYKYYRQYIESEQQASQERADILAQLLEVKTGFTAVTTQVQQLEPLQEQLPKLHTTLSQILEIVNGFKTGLADQVRLSQQDYDDLFKDLSKEFESLINKPAPSLQKLQTLEDQVEAFRQHFDKTMSQF